MISNRGSATDFMESCRNWVGGLLLAAVPVAGIGYMVSPRVSERDAAYMTVRGKLVDSNLEPGLYPSALLPHVSVVKLPQFLQSVTVEASEGSAINVRTKERARVYGNYDVMFEIDSSDPNFGNIYTELKADEIDDLTPYVQKLAVPAIIKVYKTVTSSGPKIPGAGEALEQSGSLVNDHDEITLDDHLKTGQAIAEELQKILDEQGYTYIKVKRVIPSGVGLSPEANRQLEEIVAEERKLDLLKVQASVADAAVEVTKKQSAVTIEALHTLRESGTPEEQLMQAYYLQLLRDADRIGTPFVPGPIPGTGVGSVGSQR